MKQLIGIRFHDLDGLDYIFLDNLTDRVIRIPRALLPEALAEQCEAFRSQGGGQGDGPSFELTIEGPVAS
jgi:hypothetical protein